MTINTPAVSKINWTQVVAAAAMLLTVFGIDLPAETQVTIVTGIALASQFFTMIFRSFFTEKDAA